MPADDYLTAEQPTKDLKYRVRNNALGTVDFSPVVRRAALPSAPSVPELLDKARQTLASVTDASLHERALSYLHPFMDGNGRLRRFLIHHVLPHSGLLPVGTVVPVSAVILKNIPAYLELLSGFSHPVTRLWRYVRVEETPHVTALPGSRACRFFDASKEAVFLHRMIQQAVEEEIPRELAWLSGYDKAFEQLDAEFELPRNCLSALIRVAQSLPRAAFAHVL